MDSLYIVIPAYNEEETIHKVLDQWYPIVEKYDGGGRSRLVVVDDGSRDNTHEILTSYARENPLQMCIRDRLKTPLASMKVLADSLNMQENVPVEQYQEFMQDISEEIDRENSIITDLLSLVKDVYKRQVILETIQGEGGIYPAEEEFLKGVRALCDERDILLILDEIQCGMGRSGSMFAWQEYGVEPDVMTCAKALGCGVPVGAFVLNKKTAEQSLVPGDHGTTYGGNPLACRAVSTVFDLFASEHIVEHVQKTAPYLEKKLDELVAEYDFISARRGKGFIQGLVIEGRKVRCV